MMLARIRTDSIKDASHIAAELRSRGYRIEIVSLNAAPAMPAQLEVTLHRQPIREALEAALHIANDSGCDLLIAPGALSAILQPQAEANPVITRSELEPQVASASPTMEVEPTEARGESKRSQEAAFVPVEREQPLELPGSDWMQRALDCAAVLLAEVQSGFERLPEIGRRVGSTCHVAYLRVTPWFSRNLKVCASRLNVAASAANAQARQRWSEAREQYAKVRAAALARAEQVRAQRRQAKLDAQATTVEVLETTLPVSRTTSGGWRTALAGAVVAALVIGVGFSLGARRTPAATRVTMPENALSAPAAMVKMASPVAAPESKPGAEKSRLASKPASRRAQRQANDSDDQEVIVRHFAPVKSTPSVTADGVHHYSDTDQQ